MPGPRSFEHEHILPEDLRRLEVCESRIGYRFKNPDYLHQALTHSSIKTTQRTIYQEKNSSAFTCPPG